MDSDFRREDYSLQRIHTDVWDGHIFLHLGSRPEPLVRQLGKLPQRFAPWRMQELRFYSRTVYDVKANWKLVILNFNACLHCPLVHPVSIASRIICAPITSSPTRITPAGPWDFAGTLRQ
jgi:phenylpropionate dioxygenase-like ring-hydroxylating dioxygenase large terminal subunit